MTTFTPFNPARDSSIQRDFTFDHLKTQSFDKIPVYPFGKLPVPKSLNANQGMIAFEQQDPILNGGASESGTLRFFDGRVWQSSGGTGLGDVVGPNTATDNAIARYDGNTGKIIQNSLAIITDGGVITATNLSGINTGDVTLGPVGNSSNANAASLSGQILTLQPASAGFPGVVTTGPQSFNGLKTFSGGISASTIASTGTITATGTITGSNLSGTNTGNVTLTAVATDGGIANPNGAVLTGQALNLIQASLLSPGVVSIGAQSFLGAKTFNTSIALPNTTNSTTGVFFFSTTPYFHNYSSTATKNVFLGGSGNFTAATGNALGTNFGVGSGALADLTTGFSNVGIGVNAFASETTGFGNIGIGTSAGASAITGNGNTFIGLNSGTDMTNASNNTAVGTTTLGLLTTGANNVVYGAISASNLLTGSSNVILGYNSGNALVGAESDNIIIQNNGVAAESLAIRIGQSQTDTYIAGIYNRADVITAYDDMFPVIIDPNSALTRLTSFPGSGMTIRAQSTPGNVGSGATVSVLFGGLISQRLPTAPTPDLMTFSNAGLGLITANYQGIYTVRFQLQITPVVAITTTLNTLITLNKGALPAQFDSGSSLVGPLIPGGELTVSQVFVIPLNVGELISFTISASDAFGWDAAGKVEVAYVKDRPN